MQEEKKIAIVLAAGKTEGKGLSAFNASISCMLPYKGKPVIFWNIKSLLKQGIKTVILCLSKPDANLESFLEHCFTGLIDFKFCIVPYSSDKGPGNSLATALITHWNKANGHDVFIMNGDTYFELEGMDTNLPPAVTFVDNFIESEKYTFIIPDEKDHVAQTLPFRDISIDTDTPAKTEVGLYKISLQDSYLPEITKQSAAKNLSTMALLKSVSPTISLRPVIKWVDLERNDPNNLTLENRIVEAREFNYVEISKAGILTKVSQNQSKLNDEINYYLSIPDDVKIYFPRLISHQINDKQSSYSMEYYPYKTLSEYFVFFGLPQKIWENVFNNLFEVIGSFKSHIHEIPKEKIYAFYYQKTMDRFRTALEDDSLSELLKRKNITLNGKAIRGFSELIPEIENRLKRICDSDSFSMVHGDLCFSNILLDPPSQIIRLIDPRGRFAERGIYGDIRYDLAKLLHSAHGKYDYVIHDMFAVDKINSSEFNLTFYNAKNSEIPHEVLKKVLLQHNYSYEDLVFLESLLFISMIPLHKDFPKRQEAFYLIGLQILNEVF